ncbi:MAG: ABC transporter permease [Lentimicrobiaceae bacterium]|nr:ABC transporter permease [Lentimicrobiaceae bacterium]
MFLFRKKRSEEKALSLSALTWKRFKKEKTGMVSLVFLGLVLLMAILGYLVTPDKTPHGNNQHLEIALQPLGFSVYFLNLPKEPPVEKVSFFHKMLFGQAGQYNSIPIIDDDIVGASYNLPLQKKTFLLGTDRYGRDVLTQLMLGARISLAVGFIAVVIALIIGVFVGAIAGYYGGKIDAALTWLINVVWSIPTLLLVIAISFALGKGFWQIFIAIGLTMWVDIARVVRGQMLALKQQDFVEAGKALGFSDFRIIFKHIMPNILGTLVVLSAANFSSAILMEAGLSFLGMGVQPPIPSWGMMMKENYAYIVLDKAYLAIAPGVAIMLLVLAFMLVGSALRNAMEVRR